MRILPGQQYYGIVNFIADDDSHGFVTLFENILDIKIEEVYDKTNPSLVFYPSSDDPYQKFQILKIEIAKGGLGKKETAEIVQATFFCLKEGDKFIPVDELFRDTIYKLELKERKNEFAEVKDGVVLNFQLRVGKRSEKLELVRPVKIRDEEALLNKLKLEFFYFINLKTLSGLKQAEYLLPKLMEESRGKSFVRTHTRILLDFLETNEDKNFRKYFISVFSKLELNLPDKNSIIRLAGPNGADLINLWLHEDIPESTVTADDLISFQKNFGVFNKMPTGILSRVLEKVQKSSNFKGVLESVIKGRSTITEHEVSFLFDFIATAGNDPILQDLLLQQLNTELCLKLWREEKVTTLPSSKIQEGFKDFKEEDRIKLQQQIDWESYLKSCGEYEETSPVIIENYFEHFKLELKEKLNFCCFDLEVHPRTNKIDELAWRANDELFEELDPSPEDIQELKKAIENADIVIGHNIRKFDLEKLYGEEVPELVIWDSLEIEALIRPNALSLALDTEHEALVDVDNTLKLFYYQLYRILEDEVLNNAIINLYGFNFLNDGLPYLSIKNELIEKPVKKLFHSEVSGINKVVRSMIPKSASLIICPESFWGHFRDDHDYLFAEEDHFYNLILDKAKWENKLSSLPFLAACLDNFDKTFQNNGQNPYARLLSSYLVHLIEKHFPLGQICTKPEGFSGKIITSEWYFEKHSESLLSERSENEIIQLGTDLWPFTSKRMFAEFSLEELSKTEEGGSLWVKFSNGRSYAPISKKMAEALVRAIPGEHFWIEKEALDKYNLWGSNADKINEIFTQVEIGSYYQKQSGLKKDAARYIKYSNNARSQLLDLNPETLYRDKYWDTKLKTLIHLLGGGRTDNRKCVLLVSRKEEVETLTEIIRSLRTWFSPSLKSTLRRRLERLIEEDEGIMVVAMDDFEQLLSFPSNEGVLYVMESLSPEELIQISGIGRESNLKATQEEQEETDTENEGVELPHLGSVTDSITRLNKYYDWMLYRMILQHQDNELLVLDPRANHKLFENFSCKPLPVDFKKIEEGKSREFEIITSKTQALLYAPREFEYGNLQEHLDRISIALIDGYPFKPEQKAYLDIIFPGKEDVLVTLPTGVGKSVLFQGPALYRSSFTGRMSIVVTPLKALMEDHVMGLWKKGFWNGVEYINADKGSEVQDIYRKIAGGQLLMVFITPERFRSKGFVKALEARMKIDGGLEYFVFDEAHCISQWGSEFRPDYFYCAQRIKQIRKTYNSPLLLLSATVTKQVASHLEQALYEEV